MGWFQVPCGPVEVGGCWLVGSVCVCVSGWVGWWSVPCGSVEMGRCWLVGSVWVSGWVGWW